MKRNSDFSFLIASPQPANDLVDRSPSPIMIISEPPPAETTGVYHCEHPEIRSGDSIAHFSLQARALRSWISFILNTQGVSLEIASDLGEVLSDGRILGALLKALIGSSPEGLVEPTSMFDKINNLNLALDAFAEAFPAANLPVSSAIASNNAKATVDCAWQLFYHSTLKKITYCGLEDRFAILLWIQHTVSSFPNIPLVSDFTQSFTDGLVLCALIESRCPSAIDTRSLSNIQKTDNLRKAFDLAEQLLQIPKFLTPFDVMSASADEISMIVFLTLLYNSPRKT